MERSRTTSSSEAVVDRMRADEGAQRAQGEEGVPAAHGQVLPTSTSLRRVAIGSHEEKSPSSSSNSSPRIMGTLPNTTISQTAETEAPTMHGNHLEGSSIPSTVKLTHKDSFGFQRKTSLGMVSPGRRTSSSNLGSAPLDATPVRYTSQPSLEEVYQDNKMPVDAADEYIEDSNMLKENDRNSDHSSGSPPDALALDAEGGDVTALASRTKRKLSLGGAAPNAIPGSRKDSLLGNILAGAPLSDATGSFDASQDMAASRSPLSHTRSIPEPPVFVPSKMSSVPKLNGGAKTPTSWTIPAADGQSAWTVESADGGRNAPLASTRDTALMSKQDSMTSERDTVRRSAANRTRNNASGDADDGVIVKDHTAHDVVQPSTLTTALSSRHLAARQHRSLPSKTGPQLPSAMNVLPASPPAMYWSKVPVHGSVPRRSFRAHSACLSDEVMWLFGGCDSKGCFRDLWCFDTETMCWSKPKATGDLPPPRRAHSATMVDKRLYVFAGGDGPYYFNDLYVFDTVALRWTKPDVFGQPPSPRRAHTSNYYNGQLIIFGGGNGVGALNDVYSLDLTDINRLEWRKVPCTGKVPIGRGYHTSNLVDGKLIVIGGSDGHMSFNDIHILSLDTKVWHLIKTDETHNRLGHTATQVGSYLFIVGGHDSHSYTPDILTLNLVNLQWEPRSVCGKKPPGRGYHQAWLRDSRLFVHGGFDGKEIYDDLYHIDLSAASYIPQITSFSVDVSIYEFDGVDE